MCAHVKFRKVIAHAFFHFTAPYFKPAFPTGTHNFA